MGQQSGIGSGPIGAAGELVHPSLAAGGAYDEDYFAPTTAGLAAADSRAVKVASRIPDLWGYGS